MALRKLRWRLVLGDGAQTALGGLEGEWAERDGALDFLYCRETAGRNVRPADERRGGMGDSALTVPDWINAVHTLFPKKTIERLEQDALERYQIQEMVTNPELLKRATPSPTLLKAVLHTKHLMNQEVLKLARDMVRKVVEQLMEKLARKITQPFCGSLNRQQRSFLKVAKNFDIKRTIRSNLANYDPKSKKLFIKQPYFYSRVRRHADKWQVIILVDQSGSMLDSVIHSAVTASIFWDIRTLRTHLVLFDTNIVDVTPHCTDPVETLMKVQLGGGTDIGGALAYASRLVDNPRRTIIVLITDFFEGAPAERLIETAHGLIESGVTLLGLAALDSRADPNYDRQLAGQLVSMGAHVGAMTPGELAEWVAAKVK
ncbi:MAG TPA: VWA domain-containing protein [Planctomycetota bacterium]